MEAILTYNNQNNSQLARKTGKFIQLQQLNHNMNIKTNLKNRWKKNSDNNKSNNKSHPKKMKTTYGLRKNLLFDLKKPASVMEYSS